MSWAQRLRRVCMRHLPVPHPCRGSLRLCDSAILPNRPDRPRDLPRVRWGGAGDCQHRRPGGDRQDPLVPAPELPAEPRRAAARAAGTAGIRGLTVRGPKCPKLESNEGLGEDAGQGASGQQGLSRVGADRAREAQETGHDRRLWASREQRIGWGGVLHLAAGAGCPGYRGGGFLRLRRFIRPILSCPHRAPSPASTPPTP